MPAARCAECKKKMGLMSFTCRCTKEFCGTHMNPEEHKCTYDYKTCGQAHLASTMTAVVGEKMQGRI